MEWLALAVNLMPFIIKMVGFVEEIFGDGTGETKKAAVMGATQAVFSGMQAVSTGGQKETWTTIEEPVSKLIDGIVTLANATGVWGSSKSNSATNDV